MFFLNAALLYSVPGARPSSIGLGFMVQSLATDDRGIAKMAQQVKDVLPHVPLNVIARDLGRTSALHSLAELMKIISATGIHQLRPCKQGQKNDFHLCLCLCTLYCAQQKPTALTPPSPTCWRTRRKVKRRRPARPRSGLPRAPRIPPDLPPP